MRYSQIIILMLLSGLLSCISGKVNALTFIDLPIVNVSQIRADKLKYLHKDFIVRGYLDLRGTNRVIDKTQILTESKFVDKRFSQTILERNQEEFDEHHRILNSQCIDIWDISPLYRKGKLLNHRYVVVRAKLVDDGGEALTICSGPIELLIEEVLDPPPDTRSAPHVQP